MVKAGPGDHGIAVDVREAGGELEAWIDGRRVAIDWIALRGAVNARLFGRVFDVVATLRDHEMEIAGKAAGATLRARLRVESERSRAGGDLRATRAESGPRDVRSPMPGRVIRVLVEAGNDVGFQQGLVVLEAMKMENEVCSPVEGRVSEVRVRAGDAVDAGAMLAVLVPRR